MTLTENITIETVVCYRIVLICEQSGILPTTILFNVHTQSQLTTQEDTRTLSVIGVGVRLAVCLKGAKIQKIAFCGLRNHYAPQTWGNVRSRSARLWDEIWPTKCALVEVKRGSKNFVLGG